MCARGRFLEWVATLESTCERNPKLEIYNCAAMRIAVLTVLLAVMQAAPPAPRKISGNPTKTNSDVQQQSEPKNGEAPPAPTAAKQSAGTADKESVNHNDSADGPGQKNTDHDVGISKLPPVTVVPAKRDLADWAYLAFNGLLVIVGFLQAILLCWTFRLIRHQARESTRQRVWMSRQWEVMEQQATHMEGQLAQMISSGKQTDDLIKEAISQTKNMDGQLEQMRTQTRLSVRPFVGLDEGINAIQTTALQIDDSGNARLTYVIRAKNYSNAPASNVWAFANLIVADDMHTVYEWQGYACTDEVIGKPDIGQILFPGRDRVFTSMPAVAKIIKKHERSRLQAWLVGCIGYRDQFGWLYRTKFISMLHNGVGQVVVFDPPTGQVTIPGHFVPTGGAIDAGQIPKYNYG